MDYTRTTSRTRPVGGRSINIGYSEQWASQTRTNFTRRRSGAKRLADPVGLKPDFITFVSLACEIYQPRDHDFVPMTHYPSALETHQGKGHTSLVTQTEVALNAPSVFTLGASETFNDRIIIKRPRQSIWRDNPDGLVSFITELRIRSHEVLHKHPNIAQLRGVGWDFEDEAATIPRPILLEELAEQGALDNFWKNWSFVRLSFKAKLDFCLDIADGLTALHACNVVHGDIKPENILVFPRKGARESFLLKLTDFGHSVIEADKLKALPALTPRWSAPETSTKPSMTFLEMKATDYYSYGLVLLSVMIGRPFHAGLTEPQVKAAKEDGSILELLIELAEEEDRRSDESDLEVGTIALLLSKLVQLSAHRRSLEACVEIIETFQTDNQVTAGRPPSSKLLPVAVPGMDVADKIMIGYCTLMQCSHHLKAQIARSLQLIAEKPSDPRRAAAEWELAICYFSGFGVGLDYDQSSHWLSRAQAHGIAAAQEYSETLKDAIAAAKARFPRPQAGINEQLESNPEPTEKNPNSKLSPGNHLSITGTPKDTLPLSEDGTLIPATESATTQLAIEPEKNNAARFRRYFVEAGPSAQKCKEMPQELEQSIKSGSIEQIKAGLSREPDLANSVTEYGDTPLLLSAKLEKPDVVRCLLAQPKVSGAVSNKAGETVLHVLSDWRDEHEAALLVQPLVAKGADIAREALPIPKNRNRLVFSLGIRSCPMLTAVLNNKLLLLQSLLEEAHRHGAMHACQICELGSRFRRILAISLSLLRIDTLKLLTAHLETRQVSQRVELAQVKVWNGNRLLSLYEVPFNSVAVTAMDLPESFCRAMMHGGCYVSVFEQTIDFLLGTTDSENPEAAKRLHIMLHAACKGGSLDGVDYLLKRMAGIATDQPRLRNLLNSVSLSIELGLRGIFERLIQEDKASLEGLSDVPCEKSEGSCNDGSSSWRRTVLYGIGIRSTQFNLLPPGHTHRVCLAEKLLSRAVQVRHQDSWFTYALVPNTRSEWSLQRTVKASTDCDFRRTITNACETTKELKISDKLALVLDASNFDVAKLLLAKAPNALDEEMDPDHPALRLAREFHKFGLDKPRQSYKYVEWKTVSAGVLGAGSYSQCLFVMTYLYEQRSQGTWAPSRTLWQRFIGFFFTRHKTDHAGAQIRPGDDNVPTWQRCPLTSSEYEALLVGNIVCKRSDRLILWDVIETQVDRGQPRSPEYLMMAVDSTNLEALEKLLDLTWDVNGTWRNYFKTPLQRTSRRWASTSIARMKFMADERHKAALLELHGIEGPPTIALDRQYETHKGIYKEYDIARDNYICKLYNSKMAEVANILRKRGGRTSWVASLLMDDRRNARRGDILFTWAFLIHVFVYLIILPLVLTYVNGDLWQDMSRGQMFGFSYLWALLCLTIPHPFLVYVYFDGRDLNAFRDAVVVMLFLGALVFNHVGLPYLVVAHDWRPFCSCGCSATSGSVGLEGTDRTFLVPLIAMFLEPVGFGLSYGGLSVVQWAATALFN